jgi:DNA-binding transcriptional ArsR family regulator
MPATPMRTTLVGMATEIYLAEVASLAGNPARAFMLCALLDGQALTATDLAYVARVSPQTASSHLARLTEAKLIARVKNGRYHYYRLASPLVAQMIESIAAVANAMPQRRQPPVKTDTAMQAARICYDHLAGRLAVDIVNRLCARGHLVIDEEGGEVTEAGLDFLGDFGIDLAALQARRRRFCRYCIDWTERRPHLSGAVGAALTVRYLELGWIKRLKDTRAVAVTPDGARGLAETFGLTL